VIPGGEGRPRCRIHPVTCRVASRRIEASKLKQFGYTRFERARIIGARALQITMGAPILINVPKEEIDPIRIATVEFEKGAIPITVMRDDQIIPRGATR
jgi:DNA-directed RNA polymerase subunit K